LAGVQVAPAVQAVQAPPLQTRLAPQLVPFATGACVSEQTGAPVLQVLVPAWQRLLGVHASPAWQAVHAPAPLQTRLVPQLVPGAWLIF
jgi:hypothetical protein